MAYRELYTASLMAGEQYHISDGSLALTPAEIHLSVDPRGIREGSFVVSAAQGMQLSGLVTSDNLHMHVIRAQISANPDRISWRFDAGALMPGETVRGAFHIITSCGEYTLPFAAKVEESSQGSSDVRELGSANTAASRLLDQAGRDWGSAVQLFYRREFEAALSSEEEKLLYRGLNAIPGNEQNVEEFLIAACGKKPVTFETDTGKIQTEVFALRRGRENRSRETSSVVQVPLVIRRSGWGYTHMQILSAGAFAEPAAAQIGAGDFIGDVCELPILIDKTRLHAGRNFGRLYLRSPYQEIEIAVEVVCHRDSRSRIRKEREKARIIAQIIRHYETLHLSFIREAQLREEKIDSGEWLRRAYELVQRLLMADRESPVPHLYLAQLMLMENRIHQAILELEGVRRRLAGVSADEVLEMGYAQYSGESQIEYCYRQFLTALAYNDADEITPRIGRILRERYRKTPGDWRIAWMMIQLIPEYAKELPARWNFLKKQFTNGSRSPIIYLEAYEMMSADPSYMDLGQDRRTGRYEGDAFERQVILYAVRRDIMDPDTMRHVLTRVDRRRGYSGFLYRILCAAYSSERLAPMRTMILESICRLLIRGAKAGPQYFVWYSRAVEKKLQVTKLSDFFLQSMPEDYHGEIPTSVMENAARGAAVSGDNRTYLYRYLYENKNSYPDMFDHYREEIRSFLGAQIAEHRMTDNLAALYSACLADDSIAPPNTGDLTKLSYMSHLRTTRMNMRHAVVIYASSSGEKRYPVTDGNAIIPVYGEDNRIFLEDANHNRFAASVPYTCDRMMDPVARPGMVSAGEMDDLPFALEIAGADDDAFEVTDSTAEYCALLVRSDRIAPAYRARLAGRLLRYYDRNGDTARMEAVWSAADLMELPQQERAELLALMLRSGQNIRAARWLLSHGAEYCSAQLIGEVCLAAAGEAAERDELSAGSISRLAYEAYRRGFVHPALVKILVRDWDGDAEELTALLEKAAELPGADAERLSGTDTEKPQGADTGEHAEEHAASDPVIALCEERILRQTLFSGACLPQAAKILTSVYQRCASLKDMEIVLSGLAQFCHYTFAEWRDMEKPVVELIRTLDCEKVQLPPIVQLAYLKALLESPEGFGEEEAETASGFMTSLLQNGIVFPFYRKFAGAGPALRLYDRETMIEYHNPAGLRGAQGHVVIHCSLERGRRQEPFVPREMKEMTAGFYVSSFFLFEGEQMHYFITDDPEEKNIVESGTISRDLPAVTNREDRFGQIDALSQSIAAGDRDGALARLARYRQMEYLTAALFGEEGDDHYAVHQTS